MFLVRKLRTASPWAGGGYMLPSQGCERGLAPLTSQVWEWGGGRAGDSVSRETQDMIARM